MIFLFPGKFYSNSENTKISRTQPALLKFILFAVYKEYHWCPVKKNTLSASTRKPGNYIQLFYSTLSATRKRC